MRLRSADLLPGVWLALLAGPPVDAAGQGLGELRGRVVDAVSGEPVPSAVVSTDGLEVVTLSDEQGRFALLALTPGEAPVRVDAEGYATITAPLPIRAGQVTRVTFELQLFAGVLEELLVSPDRTGERGDAVAEIDSLRIATERPSAGGAAELISESVPGATILRGGSQPGSGYRILFRGVNSLMGRNTPVVYVDGVRLSQGQAGALVSGAPSRGSLDFLDPAEIERVEVVRGPAASARFGMEAAGGVILIHTRRGGAPPP